MKEELEVLSLEVTTLCNLRCSNCFALAALEEQSSMSAETALSIITEGRKAGFAMVHFTGGEPLLWAPLFESIDLALSQGYREVLINTNATLLDKRTCEKLASYEGKVKLTCSLNGFRDFHDAIRGKGTFDLAQLGIERALNAGLSVDVFTTVDKELLEKLPHFTEYVFSVFPKVAGLFFIQLRRVEEDCFPLMEKMLSPADYLGLVRMAGFLSMLDRPVYFLENPLANSAAAQMGIKSLPSSPPITRYGKLCILHDGKITANHSSRHSYGTYEPGMLKQVLESPAYREDTSADTQTCPACAYKDHCEAAGLIRPEEKERNNRDDECLFCQKVMEELLVHA